jgi:hypothetical protein
LWCAAATLFKEILGMRVDRAIWASLGALACAVVAWALRENGAGWLPACAFHQFTGLDCPGCGMTRATLATLHGRFGEAFRCNPLGMILWPLVGGALALELAAWVLGRPLRWRVRLGNRSLWGLVCLVAGFWLLRNLPWWPFTLLAPP